VDEVLSAATIVGSVLETAGYMGLERILADFDEFLRYTGAHLFLVSAFGAVISIVVFGSYRMGRYLLLGPGLFWVLITPKTTTSGVWWVMGELPPVAPRKVVTEYVSKAGVVEAKKPGGLPYSAKRGDESRWQGVGSPPADNVDPDVFSPDLTEADIARWESIEVPVAFHLYVKLVSDTISGLVKRVLRYHDSGDYLFFNRGYAIDTLVNALPERPQLVGIIYENILKTRCRPMLEASMALSHPDVSDHLYHALLAEEKAQCRIVHGDGIEKYVKKTAKQVKQQKYKYLGELRQELKEKKAELESEKNKENPDQQTVNELKAVVEEIELALAKVKNELEIINGAKNEDIQGIIRQQTETHKRLCRERREELSELLRVKHELFRKYADTAQEMVELNADTIEYIVSSQNRHDWAKREICDESLKSGRTTHLTYRELTNCRPYLDNHANSAGRYDKDTIESKGALLSCGALFDIASLAIMDEAANILSEVETTIFATTSVSPPKPGSEDLPKSVEEMCETLEKKLGRDRLKTGFSAYHPEREIGAIGYVKIKVWYPYSTLDERRGDVPVLPYIRDKWFFSEEAIKAAGWGKNGSKYKSKEVEVNVYHNPADYVGGEDDITIERPGGDLVTGPWVVTQDLEALEEVVLGEEEGERKTLCDLVEVTASYLLRNLLFMTPASRYATGIKNRGHLYNSFNGIRVERLENDEMEPPMVDMETATFRVVKDFGRLTSQVYIGNEYQDIEEDENGVKKVVRDGKDHPKNWRTWRMIPSDGHVDLSYGYHQRYQTEFLRQRLFTWAMQLPYYQGCMLYLLAISYPFFALLVVVPGKAVNFFNLALAWLWISKLGS